MNTHNQGTKRTKRTSAPMKCAGIALLLLLLPADSSAQQPARERYLPADQLDAIFEQTPRGVMLPKNEFQDLLKRANESAVKSEVPVDIVLKSADYSVRQIDQHAVVKLTLRIEQFSDAWCSVRIPIGNLLVENATIEGESAIVRPDSTAPGSLVLLHRTLGQFEVQFELSTPMGDVGNDRVAAFEVVSDASASITVECPAERHLEVDSLRLKRPTAIDEPATYEIPVGNRNRIQLKWTTRQQQSTTQTLVFARTAADLVLTADNTRWNSTTRLSVFGNSINEVVARVPLGLEITAVESTGLEAWKLEDDSEKADSTRLLLTYRQPFTKDRIIRIDAIAAHKDDGSLTVPTLEMMNVTSHSGRIRIRQQDELRLVSTASSGIRHIGTQKSDSSSAGAEVFDFWLQNFSMNVTVRTRDRELFSEINSNLTIADNTASFLCEATVETLNAPLFELPLRLPEDWQLVTITDENNGEIKWRTGTNTREVIVEPTTPVAAGGLLALKVSLSRSIEDPSQTQTLELPVVNLPDTVLVSGTYRLSAANDLTITPDDLSGLSSIGSEEESLLFETVNSQYSGTVSVSRKPARLAARGVITSWMDSRTKTTEATVTVDVVNGTTRTLDLALPEFLGEDVRFRLVAITAVPGIEGQSIPESLTLIEQSAGELKDGQRSFRLTFDRRFLGAVTLTTTIERPRDEDSTLEAAFVRVDGAVRQHGLLSFHAYPEQQLNVTDDSLQGLTRADAGLVEPPAPETERRTALVYRYIQPDYALSVSANRFETEAVPSAVCTNIANVSVLSDSGSVQRSCSVTVECSGVQTLRFTLPDAEHSYLWSTILNGEAVEVRSDGDDYLVAIPSSTDSTQHRLEVLFESQLAVSATGRFEQQSMQLAIDTDNGAARAIDVLQQTWDVRYPNSSLLVAQGGGFTAQQNLESPGWLQQSVATLKWPSWETAGKRLAPVGGLVLILFIFTTLVTKRRWLSLMAFCLFLTAGALFLVTGIGAAARIDSAFEVSDGEKVRMSGAPPLSGGSIVRFGLPTDEFAVDFDADDFGAESEYDNAFDQPAAALQAKPKELTPNESLAGNANPFPTAPPNAAGGGFGGGGAFDGMAPGTTGGRESAKQNSPGMLFEQNGQQGNPAPPAIDSAFSRNGVDGAIVALDDELSVQQSFGRTEAEGMQYPVPDSIASQSRRAAGQQLLAGKLTGAARLSIRASVASPKDYQSRRFHSAGSTEKAGRLALTIQEESRMQAYRLITIAIVVLLCLAFRNATTMGKTALATVLLFLVAAAVPLIPNQWQPSVDGILIGTILGIAFWLCRSICHGICRCWRWCTSRCWRCCGWLFGTKQATAAGLILASAFAVPSEALAQPDDLRPDVVLPYTPGEPELLAERVFLPKEEFLKLYRQANPDAFPDQTDPEKDSVLAAFYKCEERQQVRESKWTQQISARFVIRTFRDNASVPLPLGEVAVANVQLNEQPAVLVPFVIKQTPPVVPTTNQAAPNAPVQQKAEPQQQEIKPPRPRPAYEIQIASAGLHVVDLQFAVPATVESDVIGRTKIPLLPVVSGTLIFEPPAEGLSFRINRQPKRFRSVDKKLVVPISSLNGLEITWSPSLGQRNSDVVSHAVVNTSLTIDDHGLTADATIHLTTRQGELSELQIAVPKGYSLQSVTNPQLATWRLENDEQPRLILQFQKPINGTTTIDLKLFRNEVVGTQDLNASVPVPSVIGATRDSGTVTVLAGRELEVRVQSLSGVSQLNPNDAVLPNGANKDLRRVLAWRYTRHPVAIAVRVFRVIDKLVVRSLNGVQLEPQRQLWTTLIQASVEGAPRRRIEVLVPSEFLALKVSGNDLSDWYFTEPTAGAEDLKILNLQFEEARTGTFNAVIQSQTGRTADASEATLIVPQIVGADNSSRSDVSVWLDQATTIRNFTAEGWKKTSGVKEVEQLQTVAPAISFSSQTSTPKKIELRLDESAAAFVTESVFVTNVTDTSVELTLGMKWEISGTAAARRFSFTIASDLADVFDFTIPSLRQLVRVAEGDRVRFSAHLQQPVSGQFFVLATGSLPHPESAEIRAEPPTFVVAPNSKSSITSQSHYWVIVNQSSGLLQAVEPATDGEDIAPSDIRTRIPQGFLDQSVAIRRLNPQAPNSPWKLTFPQTEQVSPAVVALAAHTTVIAEDGTWRSRHALTVRNVSRQFLPVILPDDSRFLFAMVDDKPTRIVTRTAGEQQLHMIPIPQTGIAAIPFDVSFALTGRVAPPKGGGLEGDQLQIPIPTFPEFGDDPEFGISVSRNTWKVFLPEAWQAELNDDRRRSNVVTATLQDFNLAILGCVTDNSRSMINSLKSSRDRGISGLGLLQNLAQQKSMLESQVADTAAAEADRLEVLQQLNEVLSEEQINSAVQYEDSSNLQGIDPLQSGPADKFGQNYFLNMNDVNTNAFNSRNNVDLLLDNSGSGITIDSNADLNTFNFKLPEAAIQELEDLKAQKKQAAPKSKAEQLQRQQQGESRRSRLLGRRESNRLEQLDRGGQQIQLYGETQLQEKAPAMNSGRQQTNGAQQSAPQPSAVQQNGLPEPVTEVEESSPSQSRAATGQLSLQFEIPEVGTRHDFVRPAGNAFLTLNVRNRESTGAAWGLLWALACALFVMLLLKALQRGLAGFLFQALILIAIGSLAGWLFLPAPARHFALNICVAAAILVSISIIVRSFRADRTGAKNPSGIVNE